MIKRLRLRGWHQFEEVDIEFHDRMTILAGENSTGKTSLLRLLAKSFADDLPGTANEDISFPSSASCFADYLGFFGERKSTVDDGAEIHRYGTVELSDGTVFDLLSDPALKDRDLSINTKGNEKKKERGILIPSNRPASSSKPLRCIPLNAATREEIRERFREVLSFLQKKSFLLTDDISPTLLIKETLASLAIFAYGSKYVAANENARGLFEGYTALLKKVFPPEIGFQKILIDSSQVLLCTEMGNLPIDCIRGGLFSLIDLTWRLFLFADPLDSFVVLIDEPENHLHPALQRTLLHDLLDAFPHVQWIVSTNSPFMVSASKESYLYRLVFNREHRACSIKLDYLNRAGAANKIYQEAFGLISTAPVWADERLKQLLKDFESEEVTKESLAALRKELEKIDRKEFFPVSLEKALKKKKR